MEDAEPSAPPGVDNGDGFRMESREGAARGGESTANPAGVLACGNSESGAIENALPDDDPVLVHA